MLFRSGGLQPSDVQTTDPEALATLLPPAGETLAVLVVFRMRVLPVGRLVLQRHPVEHRVLDVDDLESRTRASITRAAVRLGMPRGTAKGARATLAYRRDRHVIDLYVWPADGAPRTPEHHVERGFNVVHWADGAMQYWAVSDVERAQLDQFAALWRVRAAAQ